MIKTFTLRKHHYNPFLPVSDRLYVTGVVSGDCVKVYDKYNRWNPYWLTEQLNSTLTIHEGFWQLGERRLVLKHFTIVDVVYFKNKKELRKHLNKHYRTT